MQKHVSIITKEKRSNPGLVKKAPMVLFAALKTHRRNVKVSCIQTMPKTFRT